MTAEIADVKEDTYTKSEVYTKTEALDKFVPHNTASGYPITLTDHLADVPLRECRLLGNSVQNGTPNFDNFVEIQSVGDLVTTVGDTNYGKYKVDYLVNGVTTSLLPHRPFKNGGRSSGLYRFPKQTCG